MNKSRLALYLLSSFLMIFSLSSLTEERKISFNDYIKQGRFPAAVRGLDVTIAAGDVVSLTSSTNVNNLVINGELHCDEIVCRLNLHSS